MKGIHKSFASVHALKGANFNLHCGEVHALLGENGAGKSTLIKVLGGIYEKDEGEIFIEGKSVEIKNVADARKEGVSIIHQELVLVPYLSIADNIFLGREIEKKNGLVDYATMEEETKKVLNEFGFTVSPKTLVSDLTIAQQQMVEIVKAISVNAKIIVMDEPTSSIADKEVEVLFNNIRRLVKKGIGIIYISHKMSELKEIADRVTVMRDGEYIDTKVVKETTNDELIALMVGRSLTNYYTRTFNECSETVLKVENLSSDKVKDVSFELKKGEILGFAGLIGAGRSETVKALFGIDKMTSGKVYLNGKEIKVHSPSQMLKEGISLVPEDRRAEAIFAGMSIRYNISLKVLDKFIKGIRVDSAKEKELSQIGMKDLAVKAPSDMEVMGNLSGGNQQKAIISSWLATDPTVLILDEPTRGIDVGAKSEIYAIMNELVRHGKSIIMISSELPEILNMSDRVAVMCNGTITKILGHEEASQEEIIKYAVQM
jgi:ABC-type sugar transport system ATPase subunit